MKKIFKFIFKNKKSESEDENIPESVKEKIISAIRICKDDLKAEKDKMFKIETAAKELIANIFFVPSEYWYDELKFLTKIKNHPENKNTDTTVRKKTDDLLDEYIQQIKLCESKIKFLSSLLLKYQDLLKRNEEIIKKTSILKSKDENIRLLNKYKGKLDTVIEKNEDIHSVYEESEHLKTMRDEINKIEEDFSVQKEVNDYISKITSEFDEDVDNMNTEILREEINKLKDEMNQNNENQ